MIVTQYQSGEDSGPRPGPSGPVMVTHWQACRSARRSGGPGRWQESAVSNPGRYRDIARSESVFKAASRPAPAGPGFARRAAIVLTDYDGQAAGRAGPFSLTKKGSPSSLAQLFPIRSHWF
jgi:hypothetical protein